MSMSKIVFVRVLVSLVVPMIAAGCGGEGLLNPAFQPEVSNQTDNFQFQTTGVTDVTDTLQYTWENTGTVANVNQATTVNAGSARLTIRDAGSMQVYEADLATNGTFVTNAGTTGNWTIIVTVDNYSGTMNFRVQKNP